MEWTGRQQVFFLLQSVGLGAVQGFLLDLATGMSHFKKGQKWLLTDIAFGPIMAVVTFFGALVITDGQLHPVLLCGVFGGMFLEHILLGVYVVWLLRKLRFLIRDCMHRFDDALRIRRGFLAAWIRKVLSKSIKWLKRSKKE